MAIKLNLLPPESRVSGGLSKALGITRMLGVIGLAAFLIFALGVGAFFVISSVQLSSLSTQSDSLKSQILAQAKTESQVVLLKDRIKKIKTVQSLPSSTKNLNNIDPYLSPLTGETSVTELNVDSAKVAATLNFRSNSDLSSFIKALVSSNTFKTIAITSFGFNPISGYLVGVSFATK